MRTHDAHGSFRCWRETAPRSMPKKASG